MHGRHDGTLPHVLKSTTSLEHVLQLIVLLFAHAAWDTSSTTNWAEDGNVSDEMALVTTPSIQHFMGVDDLRFHLFLLSLCSAKLYLNASPSHCNLV